MGSPPGPCFWAHDGGARTPPPSHPVSCPLQGPDLFQISQTGPRPSSLPIPIWLLAIRTPRAQGANPAALSFGVRGTQGRQEPPGSPPQPSWAGGKPGTPTSGARLSEDVPEPRRQSSGEEAAEAPVSFFGRTAVLCDSAGKGLSPYSHGEGLGGVLFGKHSLSKGLPWGEEDRGRGLPSRTGVPTTVSQQASPRGNFPSDRC